MKKLLAMLGAAGLVVSTGAVLVSCGPDTGDKETVKALTMAKDVTADTVISAIPNLEGKIVEGKLTEAFEDTNEPAEEGAPALVFDGSMVETNFDDIKVLFNETTELVAQDMETMIGNQFTIRGSVDATNFELMLVQVKATGTSPEDMAVEFTTLYSAVIEIPQTNSETPNLDSLKTLVETLKDTDLTGKTEETKTVFTEALEAANEAITANEELADKTLEEALQAAFDGLKDDGVVETPNLDSLKELVETLKDTDLSGKTEESADEFTAALEAANAAITANEELADKTLEDALQDAFDSLEDDQKLFSFYYQA